MFSSYNYSTILDWFTLEEINKQEILFVNLGASITRARLTVSDNSNESQAEMIRFEAIDLQFSLKMNTGLEFPLVAGGSVLIKPVNLTAGTNMPSQKLLSDSPKFSPDKRENIEKANEFIEEMELRYEILKGPTFGQIQIQRDLRGDNWISSRIFTQKMIDSLKVLLF